MQRMIRRLKVLLPVGLIVAVLLSACGSKAPASSEASGQNSGQKIVIKAAYVTAPGTPYDVGFKKFKEVMESKFPGRVEVQLFPGSQLGDEKGILEQIQRGAVNMGVGAFAFTQFVPEANLFQAPFIFKSLDQATKVADGPIGDQLSNIIADKGGFKVLGYFTAGERSIISKRPIKTLDDLKGLKVRVAQSKLQIEAYSATGMVPVPLAFNEMYLGLQSGTIDAVELDPVNIAGQKLYEVAKNLTLTRHQIGAYPAVTSVQFFNSLPPDIQQGVLEASKEMTDAEREADLQLLHAKMDDITKAGATVSELDVSPLRPAVLDVYRKDFKDLLPPDLLQQIEEAK